MRVVKIWQQYTFARLDESNELVYFKPYMGGLRSQRENEDGELVSCIIGCPTEAQMNAEGWYRVVNVAEDGEDVLVDNIIYHFTGVVSIDEEDEE